MPDLYQLLDALNMFVGMVDRQGRIVYLILRDPDQPYRSYWYKMEDRPPAMPPPSLENPRWTEPVELNVVSDVYPMSALPGDGPRDKVRWMIDRRRERTRLSGELWPWAGRLVDPPGGVIDQPLHGVPFNVTACFRPLSRTLVYRARVTHPFLFGSDSEGFGYAAMDGLDLTGIGLGDEVTISRSTFRNAQLMDATAAMALTSCIFDGAVLMWASFNDALVRHTSMEGIRASKAQFQGAKIIGSKFSKADLSYANFRNAHVAGTSFDDADLEGAVLSDARFIHCRFRNTSLVTADMSNATFRMCQFLGADLRGALLAGAEFTNCSYDSRVLPPGFSANSRSSKSVPVRDWIDEVMGLNGMAHDLESVPSFAGLS